MKKLFNLVLIVFISLPVLAQQHATADSVSLYLQKRNVHALSMESIGLLEGYTVESFGLAGVQYSTSSGSFRRSQQAQTHQEGSFYSEGLKRIGRVKLAGSFLLDKQWEDSLANTLGRVENELMPYYYFAGKAGEYERQNYQLHALLSYEAIKEKLYVGMGANYETHTSTRSVDPRPRLDAFKMQLKPELSMKFKNNHQVSVGAIWGYGNEENKISYKNDDYKFSLLFPDRIFYTNQGYGYIVMKDTSSLRRYDDYSGFTMSYQHAYKDWKIQAFAQQLVLNQDNSHDTKSRTNYYLRSSYRQENWNAQLLLTQHKQDYNHQVGISAALKEGKDFNVSLRAHNYTAQLYDVDFHYLFRKNNRKRWQNEWGLQGGYRENNKEDFGAAHALKAQAFELGLHFATVHLSKKEDKFAFMLSPTAHLPLKTEINVPPTQVNVFTESVVYPDYYYLSSTWFEMQGRVDVVSSRLLNKLTTGFSLGAAYRKSIKHGVADFDSKFMPKGYRFELDIGFRIYL